MKQKINQLSLLGTIIIITFTALQASPTTSRNSKKPNILIIMADNLGYGDLSITGAKDIQTPNIDELFNNGLIFNEFYANSTVSSPTQASLLTGHYPAQVGVPGMIRDMKENNWGHFKCETTLARHFQQAEYTTALIGKWALGFESPNLPNEQGFDLFIGFLGDDIDDYYTHLYQGKNYLRYNENEIETPGHTTDLFSNWSVSFIESQADSETPFFLYLSYNTPGNLLQPKENFLQHVKDNHPGLSPERARYAALVEQMDAGVGRVITKLNETNQLKNTIIIFSAHSGGITTSGASNGKLRGGKQDMYEGGIRVPTCLCWKSQIKKGSRSHQVAITMDLFPSLCNLSQNPTNRPFDGKDLTNCIFKNEPLLQERTLFWIYRDGGNFDGKAIYAARKGAYKLMQNHPSEKFKLYNLTTDPHEMIPLSESSEHYQQLHQLIRQHIKESEIKP
ncbi:sulfatase-like hydrolase/transferase [Sunxiuqinia sp. sy24]|uniref:sulfatase-like hydrolase/transferase n=1 Tax=Sunxiuqinia sp. sy24 TaxID=3461495 RepID=UPI0040454ECA